MLLTDQVLKLGEIGDLGADFLVVEKFAYVDTLLKQRDRCVELGDRRCDRLPLCILLGELGPDLRELRGVFSRLACQELALHLDQLLAGACRRREVGNRVAVRCKCRAQTRNLEPGRHQIALHMIEFGDIDGRIQFDQHVPCPDRCAIPRMNRAYYARLGRLDDLGPAIHDDLSGCGRDNIDLAQRRPHQGRAEQQDDGDTDGSADRRWRRLDHLECGRKEGGFVAPPRLRAIGEFDDLPGSRHCCPACSRWRFA